MSDVQPSPRAEAGRLARLAWPIVVAQLAFMAMATVDVLMVGRGFPEELAGVSLGSTWSFAWLFLVQGTAFGIDPLLTQAHGAEDDEGFGRAMAHGAVLLTALCIPVVGLHLLAEVGLGLLGQPEAALPLAGRFCDAMAVGVWPAVGTALLRGALQARERMRPILWIAVVGNLVNLPANVLLMHGAFGWGGLGAVGVAWSTTIVRFAMLVATIVVAWPDAVATVRGLALVTMRRLSDLASLAMPVGVQVSLEVWGFSSAALLMGWFGEDAVAAHQVAIQLSSIAFMVPLGIGAAASTRVGNLVGAGKPWTTAAWTAVAMGAGVMGLSAAIFWTFPEALGRLFVPDDPAILAIVAGVLPVAAAFQIVDGIQVSAFGVLRGAGDTRMPALANVVGYYLLGLPFGAAVAWWGGVGPPGVWMGLAVGLGVVSGLLLLRMRHVQRVGAFRRML